MASRQASHRTATAPLSDAAAEGSLELSDDIVCVLGYDGHIQQSSAGWSRDFATPADGTHFAKFVHPNERQETRRRLKRLAAGAEAALDIDTRFHRVDGTYVQLHWQVTADRGKSLLHCRADHVDAQLQQEESHAVAVTDADDNVSFVSPAGLQLPGYTSAELVGRSAAGLIHPDDQARAALANASDDNATDPDSVSLRYRRKDGSYAWIESKSKSIIGSLTGAMLETQALMREISQLKEAQATIERLALTDALTGLANRTLLADRLNQVLMHLRRSPGFVGVLMLDLDHFKVINDTLGHQVGDAVLVEAAQRLQHLARPDDTVARFGGDEFVLVVHGLDNPADLTAFADRIVTGLRVPYRIGSEEVVATVSVGIAVASQSDVVPADLLREADMAMYRAKDQGRDRHEVYGAALQVRATERLATERLVRHALAEELLIVEYQPIVEVATGKTVQAEALLRINDAERGPFSPEHFLLVAEETGLLPAMDERVRVTALSHLVQWRENPFCRGIERVAVNLTARELASSEFTSRVKELLGITGLTGKDLSIEVTEHVLMQTSHSAVDSLAELRDLGIHVGLDDFGTGFSALSYLQAFPLDFIKIDRSFVERIAVDRSSAIVAAMIDLAHALGLYVVAEGVEDADQLDRLREFGCDRAQGFLFSPAVSSDDFVKLVSAAAA